jgi:hypothetical protein
VAVAANNFIKCIVFLLLFETIANAENPKDKLKPNEAWVCTAWRGSADPSQNSPSVCIKWTKKDCSNRLYVDICKRGN